MARLFLAAWLPEEVTEILRSLHRKDQRGVRFVDPDNWHVTLRFFGDADPHDVIGALDGVELPPVRAVLGPGVDVLEDRVLVVPVSGLEGVVDVVNRRTKDIGSKPPRKRFVGHVTLARLKAGMPMPRAMGALVQGAFDVEEIALVQSRLGAGGPKYETLETWPVG